MKVFVAFSVVAKLAFWFLVLGTVLGLAIGRSTGGSTGTREIDRTTSVSAAAHSGQEEVIPSCSTTTSSCWWRPGWVW